MARAVLLRYVSATDSRCAGGFSASPNLNRLTMTIQREQLLTYTHATLYYRQDVHQLPAADIPKYSHPMR
jgi:hypothetical protein